MGCGASKVEKTAGGGRPSEDDVKAQVKQESSMMSLAGLHQEEAPAAAASTIVKAPPPEAPPSKAPPTTKAPLTTKAPPIDTAAAAPKPLEGLVELSHRLTSTLSNMTTSLVSSVLGRTDERPPSKVDEWSTAARNSGRSSRADSMLEALAADAPIELTLPSVDLLNSVASASGTPSAAKPTASEAPQKPWAAFISHFKSEAAMEARYLQAELSVLLNRPCFIDSDNLHDLRSLQQHVRDSDVLLLLQTKGVLTRPWCLVELLTALAADVPIVNVVISTGAFAYNFAEAEQFLIELEGKLEEANPSASALVTETMGVSMEDAAYELSTTIPQLISINLNPSASKNVLAGSLNWMPWWGGWRHRLRSWQSCWGMIRG
jgi:hypothetical protein